jgi:hypothetical protein
LREYHSDTLNTTNNLAAVLKKKRELKAAEELSRQVLRLRVGVLGKKHPATL